MPVRDQLKPLTATAPDSMSAGIMIGPLYETIRDVNDPHLDPTPPEKRVASGRNTSPCAVGLLKKHALAACSSNRQILNSS
jgi:hypothetical protein